MSNKEEYRLAKELLQKYKVEKIIELLNDNDVKEYLSHIIAPDMTFMSCTMDDIAFKLLCVLHATYTSKII